MELVERFWKKVKKTRNGCWLWIAATSKGYGQFSINRIMRPAHRIAYELLVGKIPKDLTLDHLCRNRACVKPNHLEPVTSVENMLRGNGWSGRNHQKTHCLRGHPLIPENLAKRKNRRACKLCIRIRSRTYKRPYGRNQLAYAKACYHRHRQKYRAARRLGYKRNSEKERLRAKRYYWRMRTIISDRAGWPSQSVAESLGSC